MGILGWILFGLLAGAVARALTPGRQGIGCFGTLAVGVVGALLGGFLGEAVLDEDIDFGWDLKPFLLAVSGAVVLLLLLNAVQRR
ncbi:MAG TPA: GlsB/YeaQ/YmgE family stress response membrane protein [Solirubrobacteraceae bacterium]|nr:GlsB/YeaQ/YmgE family stress response membrane protein [Solirubrobacteraceae bacterium]